MKFIFFSKVRHFWALAFFFALISFGVPATAISTPPNGLTILKTYPEQAPLIAEYLDVFANAKSLTFGTPEYEKAFQILIELEARLKNKGVNEETLRSLRLEADHMDQLSEFTLKSGHLRTLLESLANRIDSVSHDEIKGVLKDYLQTDSPFYRRLETIYYRADYTGHQYPQLNLPLYRFGAGLLIFQQLYVLGTDGKNIEAAQAAFLRNLEEIVKIFEQQPAITEHLVGLISLEAGGITDPELTSSLSRQWRKAHPNVWPVSTTIYLRSVRETLGILFKGTAGLVVGTIVGKSALNTWQLMAHHAVDPGAVSAIFFLNGLLATVVGIGSVYRYYFNLKYSDIGQKRMLHRGGPKLINACQVSLTNLGEKNQLLPPPSFGQN